MKRVIWVPLLALLAVCCIVFSGCEDENKAGGKATATATATATASASASASAVASDGSCAEYAAALKKCAEQDVAFKKQSELHEKAWNAANAAQKKEMDCTTGLATLKQSSCKL